MIAIAAGEPLSRVPPARSTKALARGIEAARRAPLWREEEGSVRKNGACWFGSYLPDLPVSETTETSKEERDQSMSGNVSKSGAAARWRAQSKVCMVKAVLPESQFPVAKGLAVANAADTLCHVGQIAPASAIRHQSAWDDHYPWVKETSGTPKHTATSCTRNYGSPAAGSFKNLYGDGAVIVPKCPA